MNIHLKQRLSALLVVAVFTLLMSGCSPKLKNELNIAGQFGIAYAPLQIMKEKGLLEKKLPSVTVNWKQFGGPTAIREGMLAGEIDIGFMGPAPALIGIDNGMEWKFATGISFNRMDIIAKDPTVKRLADLNEHDRIAILSPGCTQHVLLCMAAKREFGNPHYLDNKLVPLSHPDAFHAMISGTEVTMHVTTPPYSGLELEAGMHSIYTGEEIMGAPFTFITGVAMESFFDSHRDEYDAFIEALDEAIDYINNNLDDAVEILAPVYGISEEALNVQMTYNGTIYSNRLEGIETMSKAMQEMSFTKGSPDLTDIIFPNVNR